MKLLPCKSLACPNPRDRRKRVVKRHATEFRKIDSSEGQYEGQSEVAETGKTDGDDGHERFTPVI